MRRRETFDPFKAIKKTAQKAGKGVKKTAETAGKGVKKTAETAGAGIKKTAETAGKGIKGLPGTIKDKVLAPLWNFISKLWASFKFYVSCASCMCLMSSCFAMGIPQMLIGMIASASASASADASADASASVASDDASATVTSDQQA